MCFPFRSVVFAVVNDVSPSAVELNWSGVSEFGSKCCVSLLKQLLYFSIIAVKPVLIFSGAVTKRIYGSIHNSLAQCVPLFCSVRDALKRQRWAIWDLGKIWRYGCTQAGQVCFPAQAANIKRFLLASWGTNAYAERSADEAVIGPTLSATHHSGGLHFLEVDRFDKNVV